MKSAVPVFERQKYERQGAEIISTGVDSFCSEQPVIDAVVQLARNYGSEFQSVLDVGCGAYPTYSRDIARMGKTVVGADFCLNFLRLAKRNGGEINFSQADATRMPFRDASFDAAICSETVEHIPDDGAVVAEIARVLRPKGLLFFTVPNLWNANRIIEMAKTRDFTVRLFEQHLREYSPKGVERLLSPWFRIEHSIPVSFGWAGRFGSKVDFLIRHGILRRFSKSIAVVARKRT